MTKPSASAPTASISEASASNNPKPSKDSLRTFTLDDYVVSFTNSLLTKKSVAASSTKGGFQSAKTMVKKPPLADTTPVVISSSSDDEPLELVSKVEALRLDQTQDRISKLDIDKPLLIVAGAGSGKTTTLCARVIEIIKRGVAPASILVITFTNKAADELKERIAKYMAMTGHAELKQMPFASTFHSWCYGLIMRNYHQVGLHQCPMVAATESEHAAIAKIALETIEDCRMLVQCESMLDIENEPESMVFVDRADLRWARVARKAKEVLDISMDNVAAELQPLDSKATMKGHGKLVKKKYGAQAVAATEEMSTTRALYHHIYAKLGKQSKLTNLADNPTDYRHLFDGKDIIKDIMSFIYRAKSRGDLPEHYPSAHGSVLKAYNATLKRFNLLDFDDMLKLANDLLDVSEVLESVQAEFPYLLVDEFQDLNQLQMNLVLKMQKGIGRVTAVGDERQSIYAFRGASCEHNFQTFLDSFVDAQVGRTNSGDQSLSQGAGTMASLTQNYRSHQSIVDLGNIVARDTIGDSKLLGRLRVPLLALPTAPMVPVTIWNSEDKHDEAKSIGSKIKELVDSGDCIASDIAVISRCLNFGSFRPTNLIEVDLMRSGIAYVVRGGHSALKSKRMQLFMALIRMVANTDDDIAAETCLSDVVKSLGPAGLRKLNGVGGYSTLPGGEMAPLSLFAKMERAVKHGSILPRPATDSLAAFTRSIRGWQAQLSTTMTLRQLVKLMFDEFVAQANEDAKEAPIWGKVATAQGASDGLWELVESIMDGFIDSPAALPPSDCGSFAPGKVANPNGPCSVLLLQAFSGQLCMMSTSAEDMGKVKGGHSKNSPTPPPAVVITTVHQAKGLEWKHVFIPNFVEDMFPMKFRGEAKADSVVLSPKDGNMPRPEEQHYREEGRLAYVAITRAKLGLYISVPAKHGAPWMERTDCFPSRYLPGIMCPDKPVKKHNYERDYYY
ncbi:hypothetical protein H4R26_000265 [Coemansia thaxteri]|uniref:DNA 3'-5' helicase n=1 Tax=Coemansia thaxteri TaxID=2663907 RepID=A0A9W8BP62_9FUNG|nr:hypothetical protein H4R26_000265 [Coemansia thaxteri]KAJ2487744.1 hypothetical protein EV174_000347 [Coemansia sp. RSA 2320]